MPRGSPCTGCVGVRPPWCAQPGVRPRRGERLGRRSEKTGGARYGGAGRGTPGLAAGALRCSVSALCGRPGSWRSLLFRGSHVLHATPRRSGPLLPRDAFISKILPSKGPSLLAVRDRTPAAQPPPLGCGGVSGRKAADTLVLGKKKTRGGFTNKILLSNREA